MNISEISLYNALRKKFGDEKAAELVEFVKAELKTEFDNKSNIFLQKMIKLILLSGWLDFGSHVLA